MSLLRVQEIEIIGPGKAGVPVGHPYIQLPGMPDPDEIYTGTWENVSADYEGDFFRVEGGDALAFDASNLTEQLDQMQRITGTGVSSWAISPSAHGTGVFSGTGPGTSIRISPASATGYSADFNSANSPDARTSATTDGETRPVNRTIRIWERIS